MKNSLLLIVACSLVGCSPQTHSFGQLKIYSEISPTKKGYTITSAHSMRQKSLLKIALQEWNSVLGREYLSYQDRNDYDVELQFRAEEKFRRSPGHTELLGCYDSANFLKCKIVMHLPSTLDEPKKMAPYTYLFEQGPLDPILYQNFEYHDPGQLLLDKLTLVTILHEVGHTLGLGHSSDENCLMAEQPNGKLSFCHQEIQAIRQRL